MNSSILENPLTYWPVFFAILALTAFIAVRINSPLESSGFEESWQDSPWWIRGVLALFLMKVLLLGWFMIPPRDIPDETGHYSYVADLAEGRGFPELGKSKMVGFPGDGNSAKQNSVINWIAQHPPLYYLMLTPVHALSGRLAMDGRTRFHLLRAASSLFAVAALGVLYLLLRELGAGRFLGALICGITASIPMISNMSAGINHDMFLTLLVISATWAWIRFLRKDHIRYFWLACGFFSAAAITKYTALPLAALWFFCVAVLHLSTWSRWLRDMVIGAVILGLPISLWMARNLSVSGQPLPVYEESVGLLSMDISFLDFLRDFSVMKTLFGSSICLLGWLGSDEHVDWLFLPSPFVLPASLALLLLAAVGLVGLIATLKSHRLFLFLSVAITALLTLPILHSQFASPKRTFDYAIFLFAIAIGIQASANFIFKPPIPLARASSVSHFLVVTMFLIIAWQMYERTLESGYLRAAHGRYFFPMIGFAAVGFVRPALGILRQKTSLLLFFLLLTQGMEICIWLFYAPAYYLIH